MPATVEMPLEEYEQLKHARRDAEEETARMQKQLVEWKLTDEHLRELVEFGRAALTVARFAVENLPPETIKGWPHAALLRVSELLTKMPDASLDDRTLAIELRNFAGECARFERGRKNLQSAG